MNWNRLEMIENGAFMYVCVFGARVRHFGAPVRQKKKMPE